jgi:phosphatidylglycerophosphate synthase
MDAPRGDIAVTLSQPMDKRTARTIADGLTWARIWLALPITVLAIYDVRWWVLGLYIVAALTDLFDGMFARRAAPPATDTDLDGNADVIFCIMTLVWLWLLVPGFLAKYWLPYLPILVAIQIYLSTAAFRFPGIEIPHFDFGRLMMVVFCFMLPVLLIWGDQPWFVHSVFILGTVSKLQLARYVMTYDVPPAEQESA